MSSSITLVSISASDFSACVERYLDENDADPLQQRQMKNWTFEWTDAAPETIPTSIEIESSTFAPTHAVAGTLGWSGDHLAVELEVQCTWREASSDDDTHSYLWACCKARAHERQFPEPQEKKAAKIHTKMIKRLQKDDYIAKIMSSTNDNHQVVLWQAAILVDTSSSEKHVEERVDYSRDVTEAIRRAVYSTAATPLDVVDVFCRFPFLPGTEQPTVTTKTTLADRAILRLLEDATYDACEEEGDEEIVQELQLEEATAAKDTTTEREAKRAKKR